MHRGSGATVGPAEGIVMDQTVFSLFITDPGLPQLHKPGQKDCSEIPKIWWVLVL